MPRRPLNLSDVKNRSRHPLFRAYSTIFARASSDGLLITLEDLAQAYRQRATELDPDARLAQGDSPSDVAVRIATVRQAFRMIRDVMGDAPSVWLQPWASDEAPARFVHVQGVAAPEVGAAPQTRTAPAPHAPSATRPWSVKPVPGFRTAPTTTATPPSRHEATLRTRVEVDAEPGAGRPEREAIYEDLMAPKRPLLGRFLVQNGLITLGQLIDAVHWQRRQRPPVGRIAVRWGLLETRDVVALLRSKGARTPFCRHAVDQGVLQTFQRVAILAKQRQMQQPLGAYFVEKGLLSAETIEEMAGRARAERAR